MKRKQENINYQPQKKLKVWLKIHPLKDTGPCGSMGDCYQMVVLMLMLTHSCLTLCDALDCSPPDSYIPGIFQARVPEWVAIAFSSELYKELLQLNNEIIITQLKKRSEQTSSK